MIDLHTHSFLSDGILGPGELVQRAKEKGYRVLGITDHVDFSNYREVAEGLKRISEEINRIEKEIKLIPGVELTHLPPELILPLVREIKNYGSLLIVVHGETVVEPVPRGTNREAIKAEVDILAHPGLISPEEVRLAREKGVYLEISGRQGHCFTNGWVAQLALREKAKLIFNTDAHGPGDLREEKIARKIISGTGLKLKVEEVFHNSRKLADKFLKRRKD